jgi:deazaflavin-dependent oxidoreductase (nitroreductase family)
VRSRSVLGAAFRCGRLSSANMDDLGEQLATWGKVAVLETTGRVTGRPVEVAVGYLEEPDGSLVVAAGTPDADWARNLDADPRCRVRIGDSSWAARAEAVEGAAAGHVVRELILRYGTPAERLGRGPVYRLVRGR